MIYLDYSATTPVDKEVLDTFVEVTKRFPGNPNSLHKLGLEAKMLIDTATDQIAKILGVKPTEIIYTSGASEANNTAIKGICLRYQNRGKHIITTELEHSSIIEPLEYLKKMGFEVDYVKLDENGQVDLNYLEQLMTDDTILVTISSISSELGIKQPIAKIAEIVKKYPKAYFHSDMTQSIGKEKINLQDVDLVSFSAQKFYGLKGIGCLIKKESIVIDPLINGGKSTTVYRSGTPSPALIASISKALRLAYDNFDEKENYLTELNKYLIEKLQKLNIFINSNNYSIPNIINISLKNIKSETMLHALETYDIYVSTQTACSSSTISKSIYAITNDKERASRSLRISISHLTTKSELDQFIKIFTQKINELEKLNTNNTI